MWITMMPIAPTKIFAFFFLLKNEVYKREREITTIYSDSTYNLSAEVKIDLKITTFYIF
jgi:hypothetical protein